EIRDAFAKGDGQSGRYSVTLRRSLLYYAVRLPVAGGAPVVLRFALPLQTVDQVIGEFRRRLWLASLVMLLVTGTASLLISRSFSDRVDRLTKFSLRVAEGDFRPIEADRSGDTLDSLAVSLNQTAAQLDGTIRALTELRKLERVRRDFVANVSHELRTPLTAIQGFAETLLAGAIDDPQNRLHFLEIILEHSRRLARLTEDLLMLSKMDADRLELEIRRLGVSQ